MAETGSTVYWSLEKECELRSGEDWEKPAPTNQQLYQLQTCSEYLQKDSPAVCDGILVTHGFSSRDANDNEVRVPQYGVAIHEITKPHGWDRLRQICAGCPANAVTSGGRFVAQLNTLSAKSSVPPLVGGCFGSFSVYFPDSIGVEEMLWKVIERNYLHGTLHNAFCLTDPLWYGFWMDSPLNREQCEALLKLLPEALPLLWEKDPHDPSAEPVFAAFLPDCSDNIEWFNSACEDFYRALRASIKYELPLHFHVPPPTHLAADLQNVVARCPRCKDVAEAELLQEMSILIHKCSTCGGVYIPVEAESMEVNDYDHSFDSLVDLLGDDYDEFVAGHGVKNGYSRNQMQEALDMHRGGPVKRKVTEVRTKVSQVRHEYRSQHPMPDSSSNLPHELTLDLGDGVEIEFVLIPAGSFRMGEESDSADADEQTDSDRQPITHLPPVPVHTVTIEKPFYIGRFPVTQEQWLVVNGNNPSVCRQRRHPVEQVDWFETQDFCLLVSERLGRLIRLPSEAEWEYACRAGTTTQYYCGDTSGPIDFNANHKLKDSTGRNLRASGDEEQLKTTPVDEYPPNAWGLYDMLGNVQEWCDDAWHDNYQGAPTDGSAWIDHPEPIKHVARGGAVYMVATQCTPASRLYEKADGGANPQLGNDSDFEDDSNSDPQNDECIEIDFEYYSMLFDAEYFGLRLVCEID